MSEAAQQLSNQTTAAVPPSTEAHTGTLYSDSRRFGNDEPVPEWAKGKTPREILEITEQLRNAFNAQSYQPPQQAAFSGQQLSNQQVSGPQMPNADLIYSDQAEYNRQMAAYQNHLVDQRMSQYAAPIMSGMSENSKWASMSDPRWSDVWKRWAPEIEIQMSSIPAHQRTKQLWDTAAQLVKSNHIDEIVAERAQSMAASGSFGTERAGSVGGAPVAVQGDSLDELMQETDHPEVKKWKDVGMTKADIIDYCKTTGRSVSDYVKAVRGQQTFSGGAV